MTAPREVEAVRAELAAVQAALAAAPPMQRARLGARILELRAELAGLGLPSDPRQLALPGVGRD